MPLRTEPMEEPSLNLTPMIDVVLQLVIFFMVGTQFTQAERQYEIQLPTVSEAMPLTAMPDELVVNVSREGVIFLGADETNLEGLEATLRELRTRFADQSVIIRADGESTYQQVMTILNVCKRSGISNIQLANRLNGDGGGS